MSKIYDLYDDYIVNLDRDIYQLEQERDEINKELKRNREMLKRIWAHIKREEEKLKNLNI
jgi:hypothetical protein